MCLTAELCPSDDLNNQSSAGSVAPSMQISAEPHLVQAHALLQGCALGIALRTAAANSVLHSSLRNSTSYKLSSGNSMHASSSYGP